MKNYGFELAAKGNARTREETVEAEDVHAAMGCAPTALAVKTSGRICRNSRQIKEES